MEAIVDKRDVQLDFNELVLQFIERTNRRLSKLEAKAESQS